MPMAEQISDTVLNALLDCLAYLELSDEDVVPADVAGAVQDIVVERFDDLSTGDRLRLAELIHRRVETETDPGRQDFFRTYPEDIGLTDEETAADDGGEDERGDNELGDDALDDGEIGDGAGTRRLRRPGELSATPRQRRRDSSGEA